MNVEEKKALVLAWTQLAKDLIAVRVQAAVLKQIVATLACRMGIDTAGLLDLMASLEREERERVLLSVGDTNPNLAALLGVDEVTGESGSTPRTAPPLSP